jgi:hypothetical protein
MDFQCRFSTFTTACCLFYQGQEGQSIIAGDDDLRHTSGREVWFKTRIKRLIAVSDVLIMADYA